MKKIAFLGLLSLGLIPTLEIKAAAAGEGPPVKENFNMSATRDDLDQCADITPWESSHFTKGKGGLLPNFYDFLGLLPTADKEDIKKELKKCKRTLHPSRTKNSDKFSLLTKAKTTFEDPDLKAKYDALVKESFNNDRYLSNTVTLDPPFKALSGEQEQEVFEKTRSYIEQGSIKSFKSSYTKANPLFYLLSPDRQTELERIAQPFKLADDQAQKAKRDFKEKIKDGCTKEEAIEWIMANEKLLTSTKALFSILWSLRQPFNIKISGATKALGLVDWEKTKDDYRREKHEKFAAEALLAANKATDKRKASEEAWLKAYDARSERLTSKAFTEAQAAAEATAEKRKASEEAWLKAYDNRYKRKKAWLKAYNQRMLELHEQATQSHLPENNTRQGLRLLLTND